MLLRDTHFIPGSEIRFCMGKVFDLVTVAPPDKKLTDEKKLENVREKKVEVPLNKQEPVAALSKPKKTALMEEKPPASERASLKPTEPQPTEEEPIVKEAPIAEKEVPSHQSNSGAEPEKSVSHSPLPAETGAQALVLKAIVKERTWIRVGIDNEKPKEYILSPENRPQWRAARVFELLIGNAGGIDLEFNGKKMEDLGKQGQVIRLRLPIEDERSIVEN